MLLLALAACGAPTPAEPPACNGHADLCDRPVDDVTFPATHNSMSAADEGWRPPNQGHGIERQLVDGVRGLLLDAHDRDGAPFLCHGYCSLGSEPLADGLAKVTRFLDDHPGEVVVIVFESYVSAHAMGRAFAQADLERYRWEQPLGEPWPTLAELIDADRRVLAFGQGAHDGLMPFYEHGWDNDYAAESADDFGCDVLRGDTSHPLFLLNHFLTAPVGTAALAELVNHDPLLGDRAAGCERATGDRVNLLAVDFYEIGDLFVVADRLNGLGP